MSFTPGPWKAKPSCAGPNWGWFVEGPPEADYHDSQFEKEEDARLVAAAPDLYDAVIDCLSWMACRCGHPACKPCKATSHAEAAIAKATKGTA